MGRQGRAGKRARAQAVSQASVFKPRFGHRTTFGGCFVLLGFLFFVSVFVFLTKV